MRPPWGRQPFYPEHAVLAGRWCCLPLRLSQYQVQPPKYQTGRLRASWRARVRRQAAAAAGNLGRSRPSCRFVAPACELNPDPAPTVEGLWYVIQQPERTNPTMEQRTCRHCNWIGAKNLRHRRRKTDAISLTATSVNAHATGQPRPTRARAAFTDMPGDVR